MTKQEDKMNSTQRHKLKKFVQDLSKYRGRHTELVTVYVPQDYDINKVIQHLAQEQGTATNIKSKQTQKAVVGALERMIQHLRLYKRTPPNGLAVFSGDIAEKEGQTDIQVWSVEPPVPLKQRLYRCDKEFVLEALADMLEAKDVYGLVVMDRRDASIALLKGKRIIPLAKTHSEVPGKFKAGGQCLDPDTNVLMGDGSMKKIKDIKKRDIVKSFNFNTLTLENSECLDVWSNIKEGLMIHTLNQEIISSKDHVFFVYYDSLVAEVAAEELKPGVTLIDEEGDFIEIVSIEKTKKQLMVDISVGNQNFIANGIIVHNSAARFARLREGAAKDHFKKVGDYMKEQLLFNKDLKGILVGGPGPTKHDFVDGNYITNELKKKIIAVKDLSYTDEFGLNELVERSQDVLAAEDIAKEKEIMAKFFNMLAKTPDKVAYGENDVMHALKLGAVDTLLLSEALDDEKIEEFEQEAEKTGTTVELISVDTREGAQLKEMRKVAALLRFEVSS